MKQKKMNIHTVHRATYLFMGAMMFFLTIRMIGLCFVFLVIFRPTRSLGTATYL